MSLAAELDLDRFLAAWVRVRRPGGAGVDGVRAVDFQRGLDRRLRDLRAAVLSGRYQPQGLLRRSIPKSNGGVRRLAIPTLADRLTQAAVLPSAVLRAERVFLPGVHGFRPGCSPTTALVDLCRQAGRQPHLELAVVDVSDMFDSLPTVLVTDAARQAWPDVLWARLVHTWCHCWATTTGKGVPQGAPLSPLLANLALHFAVDRHLTAALAWVRYGDDLAILSPTQGGALRMVQLVDGLLRRQGLQINPAKTRVAVSRVASALPFTLLGAHLRFGRPDGGWTLRVAGGVLPWEQKDNSAPFAVRNPFPPASRPVGGSSWPTR